MESSPSQQPTSKYLLWANFLGATGSAAILNKGLYSLTSVGSTTLDSMLAFLIGCLLSLILLYGFKRYRAQLLLLTQPLAALCCLFVFLLYGFRVGGTVANLITWTAFGLVALHFSLVSLARSIRSNLAATQEQGKLAWTELAYALGYLPGLLIWQRLSDFTLKHAAVFAILCYLAAYLLDRQSAKSFSRELSTEEGSGSEFFPNNKLVIALIALIVLLTIEVQVGCQMLCKLKASTDPLIPFYLGVSTALIACGLFTAKLLLRPNHPIGSATFEANHFPRWPLYVLVVVTAAMVGLMIAPLMHTSSMSLITLLAIAIAAFLYEAVAIVVFSYLGRTYPKTMVVAIGYASLAFGSMVAYAIFLLSPSPVYFAIFATAGTSVLSIALIFFVKPNPAIGKA